MPTILVLLCLAVPAPAPDGDVAGAWAGGFRSGSSEWPVRLDVVVAGDELQARLDMPTMGMIAEPVPARWTDAGVALVEFPFGMGEYELVPDGESLSTLAVTGSRLPLRLERLADADRVWVTEEVSLHTFDGLELPGTLYLPDTPGPHAGVVMVHGSAPNGRDSWEYRSWGPFYASRGLAALVYDKRPPESVRDLARLAVDARSAHAWLAAHDDVRDDAVGIAGGSQAAWLGVAVAADAGTNVAFLIMSGWPAVTPREQALQSLRNGMLDDGIDHAHVESAVDYTTFVFWVARNGTHWEILEPLVADASSRPWGDYVLQPDSLDDLAWWSRNMDFGGDKHLRSVSCPVLALYGEEDWVVPPAENADRLVRSLRRGGNEDVQVAVFPEADHRGEVPFDQTGGTLRWAGLAPGWFDTIETWLAEHGFAPQR